MQDVQILKSQMVQILDKLPAEGLRTLIEFASFLEAKFRSIYRDTTVETQNEPEQQYPQHILNLQRAAIQAAGDQPLPLNEPFIDNVTLGEYLELSDDKQAQHWDNWSYPDMMDLEEKEVPPHALPA